MLNPDTCPTFYRNCYLPLFHPQPSGLAFQEFAAHCFPNLHSGLQWSKPTDPILIICFWFAPKWGILLFLTLALPNPKTPAAPQMLCDACTKEGTIFPTKLKFQGRAPCTDLHQWPGLALHCKPEVAELTVAGVGGGQPVLQAAAVNGPQRPRTLAGGQQLLVAAALVADPTNGPVIEGAAAGEGEKTAGQCPRLW